jgi:hypothetical protein
MRRARRSAHRCHFKRKCSRIIPQVPRKYPASTPQVPRKYPARTPWYHAVFQQYPTVSNSSAVMRGREVRSALSDLRRRAHASHVMSVPPILLAPCRPKSASAEARQPWTCGPAGLAYVERAVWDHPLRPRGEVYFSVHRGLPWALP